MGGGRFCGSIQPPLGLTYGGGSFWYPLPRGSLGIDLRKKLKMSDMTVRNWQQQKENKKLTRAGLVEN